MILKDDLLLVFGTLQAIGDLFPGANGAPMTKGAVSQWKREIPALREYQLREIVPDIEERIARAKAAVEQTA